MDSLELNALPTHPSLLHPLTGLPLRAAGVLPSGRVVWPIMGGDGTAGDANDSGSDAGDAGDGDQGGTDDGNDSGDEGDGTDEDARIQRANRQAANYRGQLREQQKANEATKSELDGMKAVLDGLRKALDPNAKDDADPAEQVSTLTTQLTTLTDTNAALAASLVVHNLCADPSKGLGANPVALLDSQSFAKTLAGLDPAAEGYDDEVAKAIKDAVAKNAAFKSGQGSGRGGSELDPSKRESAGGKRPTSLSGAISGAYAS